VGKHHIIATDWSNIIMSEASNITFCASKSITYLPPESKIQYNTLYLAGKMVCKKGRENLVLFDLNIKLLYGMYPKEWFCSVD